MRADWVRIIAGKRRSVGSFSLVVPAPMVLPVNEMACVVFRCGCSWRKGIDGALVDSNKLEDGVGKHELHQIATGLEYILAGLTNGVKEYALVGFSLQLVSGDSYRCVLRAYRRTGADAGIRLVAFTNSDSPDKCLYLAEEGFRRNVIRWTVDQFAAEPNANGSTKSEPEQLTLL